MQSEAKQEEALKKDCRACSGVKAILRDAFKRSKDNNDVPDKAASFPKQVNEEHNGHATELDTPGMTPGTDHGTDHNMDHKEALECPPNSEQIGRSTWNFLHTMAAYYPSKPSTSEQSLMRSFLDGLGEFYPCGHCRAHLREQMSESPPVVTSASELSKWLCKIHNEVNVMLGKPLFDCSRVFERYRDGPKDSTACD